MGAASPPKASNRVERAEGASPQSCGASSLPVLRDRLAPRRVHGPRLWPGLLSQRRRPPSLSAPSDSPGVHGAGSGSSHCASGQVAGALWARGTGTSSRLPQPTPAAPRPRARPPHGRGNVRARVPVSVSAWTWCHRNPLSPPTFSGREGRLGFADASYYKPQFIIKGPVSDPVFLF